MVNTVMLVGRLAQDIEVKKLDSGREVTNVALAVNRSFKNPDGVYETDFFDCVDFLHWFPVFNYIDFCSNSYSSA